jgi:ribonucleotide reductase beta subunit family protein with ferritin-like domain
MSKQQYNLNTKTDYLNRKMFLDPEGPVTIQRFEEVKYKKIADYDSTARGFFWQPEEVSLTKDSNDFKEASDAVKHIFTSNCFRQLTRSRSNTGIHACMFIARSRSIDV